MIDNCARAVFIPEVSLEPSLSNILLTVSGLGAEIDDGLGSSCYLSGTYSWRTGVENYRSNFTASVEATVGRASCLFWIVESPQSVRQKIREARKPFPLRRGRGEAMSESGIHHKIFPERIRDGPQIPDCISVDEGLREMPEFACDCQSSQWV